jgi:hypothetical protein
MSSMPFCHPPTLQEAATWSPEQIVAAMDAHLQLRNR